MDTIDYMADIPKQEELTGTELLNRLVALAEQAQAHEGLIAQKTKELGEESEKLNKLVRTSIPEIMTTLNLSLFKLSDGSEIKLENVVQASLSEENKPAAFKWLEDHGFAGIIKTVVKAEFGKEEYEKAMEAVKKLAELGITTMPEKSIHAATLKSFVKERLAAEAEKVDIKKEDGFDNDDTEQQPKLPQKIFGVYTFDMAKIKLPKKKK